jgi:hypothetical protein
MNKVWNNTYHPLPQKINNRVYVWKLRKNWIELCESSGTYPRIRCDTHYIPGRRSGMFLRVRLETHGVELASTLTGCVLHFIPLNGFLFFYFSDFLFLSVTLFFPSIFLFLSYLLRSSQYFYDFLLFLFLS